MSIIEIGVRKRSEARSKERNPLYGLLAFFIIVFLVIGWISQIDLPPLRPF